MLVAGIICEYNPFHYGHAELIAQTRNAGATHIAAVMCGNFVQRGEPAILSKWARTKQALENGVDLVIELPLPWAIAGAEKFSYGGVFLLNALGADMISFASECGDIQRLNQTAQVLLSPALKEAMQHELSSGITFARARQAAVGKLIGNDSELLLKEPNNILGIEYLKAIIRIHSSITPFTICRVGAAHDEEKQDCKIASASHIRSLIRSGGNFTDKLPAAATEILLKELSAENAPAGFAGIERAVLAKLRTMSRKEFTVLPDISEGLENRIYEAVRKAATLDELYSLIKSKRYTHARIRRIILSAFLGLTAEMTENTPPYLRVLGMNHRGAEILKKTKSVGMIPIITNSSDSFSLDKPAANMFELEGRATDLYALCMPKPSPCGLDRTTGIITI